MFRALIITAASLIFVPQLFAQEEVLPNPETPRVRAVRTTESLKIDGVLDDVAWQTADAITDFHQQEPVEGNPPSERTEIRILYDDKNIYFAVRAFDSDAKSINAREFVRDANFSNDDKVEIIIDTYHDKRNGFRFVVNPLGTQQDALITDEGRDVNLSWDGAWISEGRRDPEGWIVEIAIPLSTLRFQTGLDTWGLNVSRTIRRKNEEMLWTSWKRSFGLERLSQAGVLTGVGEIKRRRVASIKPYVSTGWQQGVPIIGAAGVDAGINGKAGLEVAKIGLTPSLTAEFTANPDFGQAEVDNQIVNLSRFSVFFPEKRDFFLENAGVFVFGRQGSNQVYFSRRIGLNGRGQPIPLDYGAKITGKVGSYNVGFLQAGTRSAGVPATSLFVPRQQFTIARVKKDILRRSSVGAIVANRQGKTSLNGSEYNRAFGLDTQLSLSDHLNVTGLIAKTVTPRISGDNHTVRSSLRYEDNKYRATFLFENIGRNYNPEIGFVRRRGVSEYFAQLGYKLRPKSLKSVREMSFEVQSDSYFDNSGTLSTRQNEFTWDTRFKNSSSIGIRPIEQITERLTEPFAIRPGIIIPVGRYTFLRPRISYSSDNSKKIGYSARYSFGSFYSGHRDDIGGGISYRPNEYLFFDLSESYNNVRLPQGNFKTSLLSGRMNLNLSRKFLTSSLVQLNSASRLTAVNMRLRYIFRPNSDFYVIYNQTTGKGLERASYSLQFKLTYQIYL